MIVIGIAHLCQSVMRGWEDVPLIYRIGMTIFRAKITKTIAAKTEVIPPDWSRSIVAGMPSRVNMGRIQAYQPLSFRKGAFRRLRIREVNQAMTSAIRTI